MDATTTAFDRLKTGVIEQISAHFPFETPQRKLVLKSIWAEDDLRESDLRSQQEAKDKESTWGVPIKGELELIDKKTGQVITRSKMQLAKIPKQTARYGYIVDGNEYSVDHLLRLKSGIYTRVRRNGEMLSQFNLRKSPIGRFDITLDRVSKNLFINKGAKIPVYPVLKAMGVSDDAIEHQWGKAIFLANKIDDPKKFQSALRKFYGKTEPREGGPAPETTDDLVKHIHNVFDQTELYPDTTKVTLGKPFSKVTGDCLLTAATKLINVSRGDAQPDDRDSLVFKEVVHVEEFLPEKLQRSAKRIHHKIRNSVNHKDSISEILQGGALFNQPIREFFTQGGNVTERSEQTNPVTMLSSQNKTTLFAPDYGGIKSDKELTDEMRTVNPSHFGFLDPMHTPESERTGITLHLGSGVRKNKKNLETPAYNLKTGKLEYVDVSTFHNSTVVLPDQVRWEKGKPIAVATLGNVKVKRPGGEISHGKMGAADYVMPSAKAVLSYASNLIPFLSSDQGNRASMADKQIEQAISLTSREEPLVQAKTDHPAPDATYEKMLGHFACQKAPAAGKVTKITSDAVHIQDGGKTHEVHLYNHFPLNDPKGLMHSDVRVKEGDTVAKGDLIADTNYTKNGRLALGSNLRVGYIPYKGYNFEDGIVISESAAAKLTSAHLHKKKLEIDPDSDIVDKRIWRANNSKKVRDMTAAAWGAIDDDGVVKEGTKVQPGQVLITALRPNAAKATSTLKAGLGTRGVRAWKDDSLTWDEDHIGTVVRVVKDPNGKQHKIYIRTEEKAVVGDKLTGRHGNKGIITMILPDEQMPFTKTPEGEKRHLEVLLNPSGVPTRMNVGQVLETAAAKIAEKTGKPYIVNNFAGPNPNHREQVLQDLAKHGISDEELVYDPKDVRRPLGSVLVGPQYLLKLKHQVEKKLAVRGAGFDIDSRPLPYDSDHQPTKGGDRGGQGFGALEIYALLGHNARHNLREMTTFKADQQPHDFWLRIQNGEEPPPPTIPFAYQKFEGMLTGLGLNVRKEGTKIRLAPMTDKEVLKLADSGKNEIKNGHLVLRGKDMRPEKGGLFDIHATGGLEGSKWGYIKMVEPMPNPIFVGGGNKPGPVPVLLGLKGSELEEVMAGKRTLGGKSGGAAIEDALKTVDVKAEIKKTRDEMVGKHDAVLDRLNKKLKYLLALDELGMKPHEAYMLRHLPVVPPKFRPVSVTRDSIVKSPLNDLYKTFAILNQKVREADPALYGEDVRNQLRADMWNSFKALQSVGNYKPVYEEESHGQRELKGILDYIGSGTDEQPKEGYFQDKLVKRKQDLSIRSTIVPEPALGLDQVGLPKVAAMELYMPFVVAHMQSRYGMDPLDAMKHMRETSPEALASLHEVLRDRPLILKRDPALHKFSVMAFQPTLVDGKAIRIHPLVCGGFNADFDGDTMAGTVPVSREAVEEAKKMFPSQNLFSPTHFGVMYKPEQEAMLGLHLLSKWGDSSGKTVGTVSELEKLVEKGELKHTDVVHVKQLGKETTLGRLLIRSKLPRDYKNDGHGDILHDQSFVVDKKLIGSMSEHLAKHHESDFAKAVNHLKDLGNEHAFKNGFSLGLKDFAPLKEREEILARAHAEADKVRKTSKSKDEETDKLVSVYNKATAELDAAAKARLPKEGNRLGIMVFSGARGKPEQLRQMIAAPMLMQDAIGNIITTPVTRSYAEGLDLGDYWITQNGARKGTLQRAQGTKDPGAMSKDILNTTMATVVVSHDCGTKSGIRMDLDHKDIPDRYLAQEVKLKDGTHFKAGELITPAILSRLKNNKERSVLVRTPLKCAHGEGICSKCYGLNEKGKLHDPGTNIGILAGQSMGEPAVQMAMDAFHTGGLAAGRGGASVSRLERLKQIIKMPGTLRGEATVSNLAGKVTSIKTNPIGGHDVFVNGEVHYVPVVHPHLKVGDDVRRGESLSHPDAPINPRQMLSATKDMHAVQNLLSEQLHSPATREAGKEYQSGLYEKEGVRRRNVEVVVRSMTNLTKVKDPGDSHWEMGDVASHSAIEEWNRLRDKHEKPIHHEPVLRGATQIPEASTDWISRLNYQRLHDTIQQAATQGLKSDIHGSHPIPGLAYGKEFGKPPAGKPKHSY